MGTPNDAIASENTPERSKGESQGTQQATAVHWSLHTHMILAGKCSWLQVSVVSLSSEHDTA